MPHTQLSQLTNLSVHLSSCFSPPNLVQRGVQVVHAPPGYVLWGLLLLQIIPWWRHVNTVAKTKTGYWFDICSNLCCCAWLLFCCSVHCINGKCTAMVIAGTVYVCFVYSPMIFLLDFMLVSQQPEGVMPQRMQTVVSEALLSISGIVPHLSLPTSQIAPILLFSSFSACALYSCLNISAHDFQC